MKAFTYERAHSPAEAAAIVGGSALVTIEPDTGELLGRRQRAQRSVNLAERAFDIADELVVAAAGAGLVEAAGQRVDLALQLLEKSVVVGQLKHFSKHFLSMSIKPISKSGSPEALLLD